MEMKKIFILGIALLCILIAAGCSTVREDRGMAEGGGLDFSKKNIQKKEVSKDNALIWRTLSVPRDDGTKLNIELPFDFEDYRTFRDLDEVKHRETFIHKEDKSMVMINHGVITNPNKKMNFSMNVFADLIKGVKEKELLKREKRNINGMGVVYFFCRGKTEKDGAACTMEFVGLEHDNNYWMILYAYYADDNAMAEIAKRSIESIQIK